MYWLGEGIKCLLGIFVDIDVRSSDVGFSVLILVVMSGFYSLFILFIEI